MTSISWRPGWLTLACLATAMIFPIWLSGLPGQVFRGADAKVNFAAASLDADGGNPYDQTQLIQEGERLYNLPRGLHRGEPGSYSMAQYGLPPLFTRINRPLVGLGAPGYYLLALAAITLSCLLGLETLMRALGWDRSSRWLPRLFMVLSPPFAEEALVGNVSAALFVAWALAFLLARRGRPFLAGVMLSVCLLKAPVGFPAAAAMIVFPPAAQGSTAAVWRPRIRIGEGLALGLTFWLILNVLVTGWNATTSWWASLVGYGHALGAGPGATDYALYNQAGLPSVLLGHMPTLWAVALAAVPVAGVIALALIRSRMAGAASLGATTALALSGALLLSPYIHLDDLLLEALPLLVIAATPLARVARFTLVVWAVGTSVNLVVALIEANILHAPRQGAAAGFGLVLATLVFIALAQTVGRRPRLTVARAV